MDQESKGKSSLRQRIPLKLLGKKFSRTTRLVASSKVLHNAIPTRNCDIILTLPAKTDDTTLMWLLARLRARTPHILVHVRHWKNTGVYAFYLTVAYEHLLKGAEQLGILKPVKTEYGGGSKEFMYDEQQCYAGVEDDGGFFTSQERQTIVYHMLLNLRAVQGETLGKIKFLEGQSIIPLLESKKVVSQVLPLHDKASLVELRKTWVQSVTQKQPLDSVCEYFGVKIALYFAYLGHYTSALLVPTVLGVVFWFIQNDSQLMEDLCFVTFALFNVFWATVYIENWRRRSSELAYKWGTLDKKAELLQDPRPLYTGYLVTSPVTGRLEPFYPSWKRHLFRYLVSFPVIGVCLVVVFYIMLLIFQLQEFVNDLIKHDNIAWPTVCQFLPKVLLAVSIGILDEIYKKIAFWLNDKENYRLDETYENHLIIKLVLFVNSFLSLFYIAFYLQDMNRLRDQLATLLITRQVIGNIREALVPYVLMKMKLMKVGYDITGHMSPHTLEKEITDMTTGCSSQSDSNTQDHVTEDQPMKDKDRHNSALILTQAEIESTMKKYEGTFDDYLEMFIQYGYVILFSSAFPLAALCAFINNMIEIRSDAFKLCSHHQRPFGKRVQDMGIWLDALRVMGVIAVVVNSALIGVSGQMKRMKPDLDTTSIIIIIVALEHIILVVKMCISYAIPHQSQWIVREMARWEFQRREALKSVESQSASPRDGRFQPFITQTPRSPSLSPTVDTSVPVSTPSVPVRRHSSSISSLTTTESLHSADVISEDTSQQSSSIESSSRSSNLSSACQEIDDKKTEHCLYNTEIKDTEIQPKSSFDNQSISSSNLLSTNKQNDTFTQKVVPNDANESHTVQYVPVSSKDKISTKSPSKDHPSADRPSGVYSLANNVTSTETVCRVPSPNAREETRQRIRQSAKNRQNDATETHTGKRSF